MRAIRQIGSAGKLTRTQFEAIAPNATFLSQLIAQRYRDSAADRSDDLDEARVTYRDGAHVAERRMPPGYRKTLVV